MKFFTFLQESDGSWSWGRVIGLGQAVSGIFALVFVVIKHQTIPDPMTLGGLAAWSTSAFMASKGLAAFARPANADKL